MFETQKIVGANGDYTTLKDAFEHCPEGTMLLIKGGEYVFDAPIEINKNFAIQAENDTSDVVIKAPAFNFNSEPNVLIIMTKLILEGHINITNGSTVSFEACTLRPSNPNDSSIVTVIDSSPNFRLDTFVGCTGYGIDYQNSKGGICTDCTFERIGTDSVHIQGEAKPFHQHNKTK